MERLSGGLSRAPRLSGSSPTSGASFRSTAASEAARSSEAGVIQGWLLLALALVLGAICPAEASPCVFTSVPPRASFGPGDQLFASGIRSVPLMGISADKPLTLTFHADVPTKVEWRAGLADGPELRERLVVEEIDGGGAATTFCETDWTRLAHFGFDAIWLESGKRWRLEVFEENLTPDVSILDENRGSLVVTGPEARAVRVAPAPLPLFIIPGDAATTALLAKGLITKVRPGAPVPACPVTAASDVHDARPLSDADLPDGSLDVAGISQVVGGRRLFLKVGVVDAGASVRIRIEAKPVGRSAPTQPVCTVTLRGAAPSPDKWIVASAPWSDADQTRWMIVISARGQTSALHMATYRDRPPTWLHAPAVETDKLTCSSVLPSVDWTKLSRKPGRFQSAYALSVDTGLTDIGAPAAVLGSVAEAILLGVQSWRQACTACTPYQFSVIDIDGTVYVASSMLRGPQDDQRATFARGYPWDGRFWPGKGADYFLDSSPYVPVHFSDRQRARFCAQADERIALFSAARSPLCRPTVASSAGELRIHLRWRMTSLECGPGPTTVACWNGTDAIEFNLHDFSFYREIGHPLLGTSPHTVDLARVFAHEIGHWLGLGHMTTPTSIMSARFGDARCIDDKTTALVNKVAAGTLRPFFGNEALLYN